MRGTNRAEQVDRGGQDVVVVEQAVHADAARKVGAQEPDPAARLDPKSAEAPPEGFGKVEVRRLSARVFYFRH